MRATEGKNLGLKFVSLKMSSLKKIHSHSSIGDLAGSRRDSVESNSVESEEPKKLKKVKIRVLDILIEYVDRVINEIKTRGEEKLDSLS